MKIKLLKDIPGYKAGEVLEFERLGLERTDARKACYPDYRADILIADGFAEEVKDECKHENFSRVGMTYEFLCKSCRISISQTPSAHLASPIAVDAAEKIFKDEIDIEEIRRNMYLGYCYECEQLTLNERDFFTSYRTVKAVIEKLNGDKKGFWEIKHFHQGPPFGAIHYQKETHNILPRIATSDTAEKVISLCEPELEVLFGVK